MTCGQQLVEGVIGIKVNFSVNTAEFLFLPLTWTVKIEPCGPCTPTIRCSCEVHLIIASDYNRPNRNAERNQFGTVANRLPELKDWRRKLQRGVDRLRDHLCRQHVLELIYYSDEPESQLSPETYLNLDNDGGDPNWLQEPMPSPIFQASFVAYVVPLHNMLVFFFICLCLITGFVSSMCKSLVFLQLRAFL